MDSYEYALFKLKIIRPSSRAAQSHTQLFNNSVLSDLPIVFKPGRQSITDLQCFLVDTDYNRPLHNLRFPLVDPVAKMSSHIPLDCMPPMKGYFSTKQPNCFVWEEGYFEKGCRSYLALVGDWDTFWGCVGLEVTFAEG